MKIGLVTAGEGGAGIEILSHDIKAGVGVNALAGIQGYVEATPTIAYAEKADPKEGKKGEARLKGHMEIAALGDWPRADTNVYLCGPLPFMQIQWQHLIEAGVPASHLHREIFGPEMLDYLL